MPISSSPSSTWGSRAAARFLMDHFAKSMTRYIYFTGRRIPAAELHRLGVISACVPREKLMDEAMTIAREIAAKSPVAVREVKRALNTIEEMPSRDGYRFEQTVTVALSKTEDAKEAQRAFIEKRKPEFKGTVGYAAAHKLRGRTAQRSPRVSVRHLEEHHVRPIGQHRVARAGDRVGHRLDDRRRRRPVVAAGKAQHGHLQRFELGRGIDIRHRGEGIAPAADIVGEQARTHGRVAALAAERLVEPALHGHIEDRRHAAAPRILRAPHQRREALLRLLRD